MSKQSDFCVNTDGHVVWRATGKRVHEQELGTLNKGQKSEYGFFAVKAFDGVFDHDSNYRYA